MSSKKTNKPQKLWFGLVNLAGLYDTKPTAVYLEGDDDFYATKDGDFCLEMNKLNKRFGYNIFVSEEKKEVKLWIDGAKAVMTALQEWSDPAKTDEGD